MPLDVVYMLHHGYGPVDLDDLESQKLLGCFETAAAAESAIGQYSDLEGFKDQPEGYSVTRVAILT